MATDRKDKKEPSRTRRAFYLNESHEISSADKGGGGGVPKLAPIDWSAKGGRVATSLVRVRNTLVRSRDPVSKNRYFVLTKPEPVVRKFSERKEGTRTIDELIDYRGKDATIFSRLGIDLLGVMDNGNAIVHVGPEVADRLQTSARSLQHLGLREQARWSTIHAFDVVPRQARIDDAWLRSLDGGRLSTAVLEIQPLLTDDETAMLVRALQSTLSTQGNEKFVSAGSDYSGRTWFRCVAKPLTLEQIAEDFFSIQSIHQPFVSGVAASITTKSTRQTTSLVADPVENLPVVGVLDCGIPTGHLQLAKYCRGRIAHPEALPTAGSHGSSVASRIVFGDFDVDAGLPTSWVGQCRFLDIGIRCGRDEVDDKFVVRMLETARASYPDVRVFNLSFSNHTPMAKYPPVTRIERIREVQELDNFIFFNDIVVVIAAGNVGDGSFPSHPYPQNHNDDDWHLGHWACSFNGLSVGSFVERVHQSGLASLRGAPSPFCKTGPGFGGVVGPDMSANGGDWNDSYNWQTGLGVSCLDDQGRLVDRSGTSLSTPLIAREAAIAISHLASVCDPDSRLLSSVVKALLYLTATTDALPESHHALAHVTLGRGFATASSLVNPQSNSALFLWQGTIQDSREVVRLQLPIPIEWIDAASCALLEIVSACDVPANATVDEIYGCRRINVHLRANPDSKAVHPRRSKGTRNHAYPLSLRTYDLKKSLATLRGRDDAVTDVWTIEVEYAVTTEYPIGRREFGPEQQVALALRLRDEGGAASPYAHVESHPLAKTMTRLSRIPLHVRTKIRIDT